MSRSASRSVAHSQPKEAVGYLRARKSKETDKGYIKYAIFRILYFVIPHSIYDMVVNNELWLKSWGNAYASKQKVNKALHQLSKDDDKQVEDVPADVYTKLSLPIIKPAFLRELNTVLEPFGIERTTIQKTFEQFEGKKHNALFNQTRKWMNLAYEKSNEAKYKALFREAKQHLPTAEEVTLLRKRLQNLIMGKYKTWLDLWYRKKH